MILTCRCHETRQRRCSPCRASATSSTCPARAEDPGIGGGLVSTGGLVNRVGLESSGGLLSTGDPAT